MVEKLTLEAKKDAPLLPSLVTKVEDANKQFSALEPPEELKSAADDFAANNEESLALTKEAETAAADGDQQAYADKVTEIQKLDKEGDKISVVELGATDCGG